MVQQKFLSLKLNISTFQSHQKQQDQILFKLVTTIRLFLKYLCFEMIPKYQQASALILIPPFLSGKNPSHTLFSMQDRNKKQLSPRCLAVMFL